MTYFEQVAQTNRNRGMSGASIPYDGSSFQTQAWQVLGRPGRMYSNQCRTKSNPQGWVIGSGGNDYPTPLDITYSADDWAALQFDTQIAHGQTLLSMGYSCANASNGAPASTTVLQQLAANSPFITAPPPVVVSNTPLVNGWSGGAIPPPVVVTPTASKANISFSTTSYTVGGNWVIIISGAKPNASVTVKSGTDVSKEGTTDANGNWSLHGTFGNSEVGNWNETWYVDGVSLGDWSFNVSVPQSATVQQNSGGSQATNTTNTSTQANNNANLASSASALGIDWVGLAEGSYFAGIPNIALVAVVGIGAVMMMSKGGR